MTSGDRARKALATFRLEGELAHREDGYVGVRRGGSLFEVAEGDVAELHELDGNRVQVLVNANAQLTRTSLLNASWQGAATGLRPIFDDCSDCTECSVCSDCTECSVCSDCTECSVCSDCVTECSVCTDCSVCSVCTECSVCSDCTECSVCAGPVQDGPPIRLSTNRAWLRRSSASPVRVRMLRRSANPRSR